MNYLTEKRAMPACAFSARITKELYNEMCDISKKTGNSKNKILNMALEKFFEQQKGK